MFRAGCFIFLQGLTQEIKISCFCALLFAWAFTVLLELACAIKYITDVEESQFCHSCSPHGLADSLTHVRQRFDWNVRRIRGAART